MMRIPLQGADLPDSLTPYQLWRAYRLRWKRRRFLARSFRKARELAPVHDQTSRIAAADILLFATVRNEAARLPHFLDHYRGLGVAHFLVVDNGSSDGSQELLRAAPDVSLWTTEASYKRSRFGIDWVTALQRRYGTGHWCLTVDADELLVYPDWQTRPLPELTAHLAREGRRSFGAIMVDLYPKGALSAQNYEVGADPLDLLCWFDTAPHWRTRQADHRHYRIQGGVRSRVFFAEAPHLSPTLNKVPLIRRERGDAYVTSTHAILPKGLNAVFDYAQGAQVTGALLHTKFLPQITQRAAEEKARREHFMNSEIYEGYYDALAAGPDLWSEASQRFAGWETLLDAGLMDIGTWAADRG